MPEGLPMLIDKAYEGNETRQLVLDLGMIPVVLPKSNRLDPWEYDRERYKNRNEVERLFRRLKGFRRIFFRFEKLDLLGPLCGCGRQAKSQLRLPLRGWEKAGSEWTA
jgi:transposase